MMNKQNEKITLSPAQLEGLGKVGDTANQIAELVKLARAALETIRDRIDIDDIADRIGPEVEALTQTLGELTTFLEIDSLEALHEFTHENLQRLDQAHIKEAAPELIRLIGALYDSGLLKILLPLLKQMETLTANIDPEQLSVKLQQINDNLRYWTTTARAGARILADHLVAINLPDKVAIIEEMADQWWQIAMRAKKLAQGDANNLADRLEWLLGQAEHWGNQLEIAMGTINDLAPEIRNSMGSSAIGAKLAVGVMEWMEIATQAKALIQGDAESLSKRVRTMLDSVHEAGVDKMVPEIRILIDTINRTGLLLKINILLTALEPHMPSDEQLKVWIEQGAVLTQRYQPQIAGALPALNGALKAMEGAEQKGGGIFGLLGIVFSRKTQYVLKFIIEFTYRFLRGNKEQAGSSKSRN